VERVSAPWKAASINYSHISKNAPLPLDPLALGSSLFVGVASDIYPAQRGAQLNLVDALRFEWQGPGLPGAGREVKHIFFLFTISTDLYKLLLI
jgi:hypothetical protein